MKQIGLALIYLTIGFPILVIGVGVIYAAAVTLPGAGLIVGVVVLGLIVAGIEKIAARVSGDDD